jgi:PAS domain S-box-containing protein
MAFAAFYTAGDLGHSVSSGDSALTGVDPLELAAELGRGLIADNDGASLVIVDADLRIVLADGGARQSFEGWSATGDRLSDVFPAGGWKLLWPRFQAALAGGAQAFEYDGCSEGTTHWVRLIPIADGSGVAGVMVLTQDVTANENGQRQTESSIRAVRDRDGRLLYVRGTSQDVTEQELARQNLAGSRDFLQATLDSLATNVAVLDETGMIVMTNRPWVDFAVTTGGALFSSVGDNYLEACDGAPGDAFADQAGAGLRGLLVGSENEFSMEYPCRAPGIDRYFVMRASRFAGPGAARLVVSHQDVTTRRQAQDEVVSQAKRLEEAADYLGAITNSMGEGLYATDTEGRVTYMNEAAEQLLGWSEDDARGQVMHDLIHNRHPDGSYFPIDECPILSARHGETVRVQNDMFIHKDGHEIPVGYTASPFRTGHGAEGCVVVFVDITHRKAREQTLRRDAETLAWIDRIQTTLVEERFVLYAQPIIEIATMQVVQHELLLRIKEPDGTTISPGRYLEIAEQYGLIDDIDRWVIRHAMTIAATGLPVQINISARSVVDPTMLEQIERWIEQHHVDPRLIVFEITETALMVDEAAARVFAQRLHGLGCKLALDDFGTGYGSFSHLKQIPIDSLKIDIEFVRDLAVNSASRLVVEAVVALAEGLNVRTVGEGVEDAETLVLLRELGVEFAQGCHLGRPQPLSNLAFNAR